MARYSLLISSLIAIALLLGSSEWAQADETWDGFQITCSKELNYFSIKTIALMDMRPQNIEEAKRIETKDGIYGFQSILKHPYKCDLPSYTMQGGTMKFPARHITVEIADYRMPEAQLARGECGALGRFSVIVRVNGIIANEFQGTGSEQCRNPYLMELDVFNRVKYCRLYIHDMGGTPCHEKRMSP